MERISTSLKLNGETKRVLLLNSAVKNHLPKCCATHIAHCYLTTITCAVLVSTSVFSALEVY